MKEILLVSIAFSPNVGGIETHFDDLTRALAKRKIKTWILTYKPITTKTDAPFHETRGIYQEIYRIPWLGNFFYSLVNNPLFEFVYLVPGLFLALPFFLAFKGGKIRTIHSHGLVAGFVSVFWGKIFGRRVITTTHSIYHFPKSGPYRNFAHWIFKNSDTVLTLSIQSSNEIMALGIDRNKVHVFTYWIDLNKFKKVEKAKEKVGWKNKFVILFVGRLVQEKGVKELLDAAKIWDERITLVIVGTGPLEKEILSVKSKKSNIIYIGKVDNDKLPIYYSAADLTIVPSVHEEGFGRVILESLACGTPVIGSNRGAIPEAMDETVGRLIDVTPLNIKSSVEYFYKNQVKIVKLSKSSRSYALKNFSEKNVEQIAKYYEW